MPKSKVSDDKTAFLYYRLRRRSNLTPVLQNTRKYAATGTISMSTFLRVDAVYMSSEPDFGGAVFWSHRDKRNVDDQGELVTRVGKVGVRMHRLSLW